MMDRVSERLRQWWKGLDDRQRAHGSVLALLSLGYLGHYLVYCVGQPFYIEDAGISFAYARNLVQGEGLVTWAGGERVEGYSNALWTFLIALFNLLGVSGWVSSKIMGAVFGVLALPLAHAVTRRAMVELAPQPGSPTGGPTDALALLAPLCLALSPQFVIWNASGLENSLYVMLLLAGLWRLCVEAEQEAVGGRARPWSALIFVLVVLSRPEGAMYAAAAAAGRLLLSVTRRRPLALLTWLLVLLLPVALYNGWRYWYFGWPLPNTYYAKAGAAVQVFYPFDWTGHGWKQVNGYYQATGLAWALPLLAIAMTGLHGWRRLLSVFTIAWLGLLLAWDGKQGLPALPDLLIPLQLHWVKIRVWSLLVFAVLLGLANFGRPGWLVRGLLWCFFCGGVFFHVYTGSEWMKGWRWFNIIGVSMFPLMVTGLGELLDGLPQLSRQIPIPGRAWRLPAWTLPTVALLGAFAFFQVEQAVDFAKAPETSVRDIHRRVRYMRWVQHRLDLDEVRLLDVDMGAHMYFSDWEILDIAGLVDVPIAHHRKYDKAFVREYLFKERVPDFAHVHSSWARASKIPTHSEWKKLYLEIPGYPIGTRKLHVGNHILKSHLVSQDQVFAGPVVEFEGELRLLAAEVEAPLVPQGGRLYVHLVFQAPLQEDGFQVLAFLDDGQGHRGLASLDPGYGWYPVEEWKRDDQVHGRFRMPVQASLPPGEYRLGLVMVDEVTGRVRPVQRVGEQAVTPEAPVVFLAGEYLLPEVRVRIGSREEALAAAGAGLDRALELARGGDCEGAWPAFKEASRHVLADQAWRDDKEPAVEEAIAACLVRRAQGLPDSAGQVATLVQARRWDHRVAGLDAQSRPLAREFVAQGDSAFAAEEWEEAYTAWSTALSLDPRLSHVRRKAEEARDYKLGIRRPGEPYPPPPRRGLERK